MDLPKTLARYRISVVLALVLLAPGTLAVLLGPEVINTATALMLWVVGLFALGASAWELWRGVSRWRSRRADDSTPTDAGA